MQHVFNLFISPCALNPGPLAAPKLSAKAGAPVFVHITILSFYHKKFLASF
jgi:hypothetical protein